MSIILRSISREAAEALIGERTPGDVRVAEDHPTEFSTGVAQAVGSAGSVGPFFIHREDDDLVVGEIGGSIVSPGVVEIGYAVVRSCWGRGYATEAVRALAGHAREDPAIERLVAHTPLDRPQSGRVLEKAGFAATGEVDDADEGIRVTRWELDVS